MLLYTQVVQNAAGMESISVRTRRASSALTVHICAMAIMTASASQMNKCVVSESFKCAVPAMIALCLQEAQAQNMVSFPSVQQPSSASS